MHFWSAREATRAGKKQSVFKAASMGKIEN
jgi:hypothetical protein